VAEQISQQLDQIGQDKDKAADKLFLLNAGVDSQFEVAISQAVMQKTQDQNVKEVAQRIVQDHTQANQQLMQTAQKIGLQVPQGVPEMKQKEIQVITNLDEQQMNQQYISCMQNGHAKDVMAFRTASQIAKDDGVKQFASQTLPTLSQHWQHVQQAATALGLPAGGRGAAQAGYRQGGAGGAAGSRSDSAGGSSGSSSGSGSSGAGGSGAGGSSSGGSSSGGTSSGGTSTGQ
jgi:putative membrane protein